MSIGSRLARLRKRAGKSQRAVARSMGIAQSRVAAIEQSSDLLHSTIVRFCASCGFDSVPDSIINGKGGDVSEFEWTDRPDYAAIAQEYRSTLRDVVRTSERRRLLPRGSSRARVTTANARWMSACAKRDRERLRIETAHPQTQRLLSRIEHHIACERERGRHAASTRAALADVQACLRSLGCPKPWRYR